MEQKFGDTPRIFSAWQDAVFKYPIEGCFYFILLQFFKKERITKQMKKILSSLTLIALCLSMVLCFAACKKEPVPEGIWANATYTTDTTLGEGDTTLTVEVKIEDKSVKFTINTDADTVGAALLENDLIAGETSEYGLYVKVVNGVTADYDIDQSYWAFYINGEYAMSGVDTTPIVDGEAYLLEYTK